MRALAATAMAYLVAATFSACSHEDENTVERRAWQFAQHYFNLRYRQAAQLCTGSSLKWIKYRAANISQSDLDTLNSQADTAECAIDAISYDGNSATVRFTVKNFLRCDSVNGKASICKTQQFEMAMKKHGDTWFAQLDSLL